MSAKKSETPRRDPQPIRTAAEAGTQDILSLLLENTRDAIYLLAGRRFPIINRGFQEMFGITPEEANSPDFNFMNLVAPESQPLVIERAEKYAKGEPVPPEYEFHALTKDGRRLIVRTSTSRVNYMGEETTLGIVHDITARKEIEEALLKNEAFLESIFESIQDGISILNPDLTIRRVNNVMKKWYAENLPLEGRKCYECYHNITVLCDPCPTMRCIESGQTERDIVPGLAGTPVEWLELYSYPIKDETTGEVTGVAEFVRDITENRRAELAILESEERFRMAFDYSHIGRAMASPDGRFTKVNRSMCDILGYTQEELLQKTWTTWTSPCSIQLP